MIKVTNLKEIDQIQPLMLKAYIAKKMTAMMQEYQVENMDDIGCFIVLEPEEFTDFPIGEMEFVEMLFLEESMFLHGVSIDGFTSLIVTGKPGVLCYFWNVQHVTTSTGR